MTEETIEQAEKIGCDCHPGRSFVSEKALTAHLRWELKKSAETVAVAAEAPVKREARDLRIPSTHRAQSNLRSLKVFVPSCKDDPETGFEGCEDQPGAHTILWAKGCVAKGHDPFHTIERHRKVKDKVEPILGVNGEDTGRYQVVGQETVIELVERPNLKQVQVTPHVSGHMYGFDSLLWARANGAILATDHPTKPLKEFCEYYNCWSQHITSRSKYGNFCDETAAKRIALQERGTAIEAYNQQRLQEQLDSVRL